MSVLVAKGARGKMTHPPQHPVRARGHSPESSLPQTHFNPFGKYSVLWHVYQYRGRGVHVHRCTRAYVRPHAHSKCQLIVVHRRAGGVLAVNHKSLFYGDKPFGSWDRNRDGSRELYNMSSWCMWQEKQTWTEPLEDVPRWTQYPFPPPEPRSQAWEFSCVNPTRCLFEPTPH